MTGAGVEDREEDSVDGEAEDYDPFARGPFPVGVRTVQAEDSARGRVFPCELWYPAAGQYAGQDVARETQDVFTAPPLNRERRQLAVRDAAAQSGTYPLIIFSHSSGGNRLQSTFLCTHLSSYGYVVAALDHSEVVVEELARPADESYEQKAERQRAWMANRVSDIRFLLDYMLGPSKEIEIDSSRVGIIGHSFGGWTALAATEADRRIRAVVGLAPGGSSNPKPGILPAKLTFNWGRDVPALYLVAENDVSLPLEGMYEIFERTPATKRMLILRHADHMHFMDNAEELHEAVRSMPFAGELAWIPKEMRPIEELCSSDEAHLFVRGLAVSHMDANLKQLDEAQEFLSGDLERELKARGVEVKRE